MFFSDVRCSGGICMKLDKKSIIKNLDFIYPKGGSLQAKVFDILAKCGLAVCIISAIISVLVEDGFKSFFWNMLGALISLVLLKYTRKTGRYRPSMILTIIVIFIGLFSFLFFTGGGYHSGMPCFFIFATVFTAFMLDGIIMPIFVFIELAWYSLILMWAHYNPESVKLIYNEKAIFADVWVDVLIVSLSLSITMYLQMKAYRNKEKELGEAILVAEEANRAKSDFLAKMSHDIRTPLNTIMAMNEMIVDNTSSARIRGWINDSNVSGRILLSLIDDMLDLTKIEAGRMDLLSQPWDTGALFSEIARLWKVQAKKEGLEFEYEMDAAVPPTLLGDEDVNHFFRINKTTNFSSNIQKKDVSALTSAGTGIWYWLLRIRVSVSHPSTLKTYSILLKEVFRIYTGKRAGAASVLR